MFRLLKKDFGKRALLYEKRARRMLMKLTPGEVGHKYCCQNRSSALEHLGTSKMGISIFMKLTPVLFYLLVTNQAEFFISLAAVAQSLALSALFMLINFAMAPAPRLKNMFATTC